MRMDSNFLKSPKNVAIVCGIVAIIIIIAVGTTVFLLNNNKSTISSENNNTAVTQTTTPPNPTKIDIKTDFYILYNVDKFTGRIKSVTFDTPNDGSKKLIAGNQLVKVEFEIRNNYAKKELGISKGSFFLNEQEIELTMTKDDSPLVTKVPQNETATIALYFQIKSEIKDIKDLTFVFKGNSEANSPTAYSIPLSDSTTKTTTPAGSATTTPTTTSTSSTNAISSEMKLFMSGLDGKSSSVSALLTQYGIEDLDTADMELYNLKNAQVTKTYDNSCYDIKADSGSTVRRYKLCWKDAKIISIKDISTSSLN